MAKFIELDFIIDHLKNNQAIDSIEPLKLLLFRVKRSLLELE